MAEYSIGLDLGGTNLRAAAIDRAGHVLDRRDAATNPAAGREAMLGHMVKAISELRDKCGAAGLAGIGIGVPGFILLKEGVIRNSNNLACLEDFPIRAEIERRLGTHVILENDANAAALGEKWMGAGRDVDDLVLLTLGTGVGGGLVLGGLIWRGANGMAGEWGHATVEPDGHPCGCGNRGCLEQYASATAVVRMAREAIAGNRGSALARAADADSEFGAKAIYQLAIDGDEDAGRIFRYVGRCLGIMLATLVNSLNLPMYVIGGGVSSAWQAFSPSMFEQLRWRSLVYALTAPDTVPGQEAAAALAKADSDPGTIITASRLGSDAGLYGAARLPMISHR